ncbi:MAG: regulatory iron-sulfur-containing complex subunit RicT, partial [Chloroflexota bacterium]|nr:regulatory iron-sulfur-containing complex subunit RicT [Chloroflexota bacterium]
MPESVGIRFKQAGPIYSFDPAGVDLDIGDLVIVETTRGQSMGKVTTAIQEMPLSQNGDPLKLVVRKAEPEEISKAEEFKATEGEALEKCAQLVAKHELPMKLVAAEYNFDGSHLTIYFSAENKVDFRALLKELGTTYKTRVELRQIGARDVTKLIGGLGRCGRPICCSTHLSKFDPISVRMA